MTLIPALPCAVACAPERPAMGLTRAVAARAVWRTVTLAALCLWALAGCQVTLNEQQGIDPCTPNPCQTKGVCGGWSGTCTVKNGAAVCGPWKWTAKTAAPKDAAGKALTKPAAYEASEASCDGKDNDCDGQTDENIIGAPAKVCLTKGVCEGANVGALCVGGQFMCSYVAVNSFQATETTCDGKDNDCDGQTDEDALPKFGDCKRQGVCAGLAAPTCTAGSWDCGYTAATDYEAAETKCDGKDNDCDGFVDANLSPKALDGGQACKAKGVCATGTEILCLGGAPTCSYAKVSGYEAQETLCDGLDNDCDGNTDNFPGTSVALLGSDTAGCLDKGQCAKGGAQKSCVAGKLVCNYAAVQAYEVTETSCDGKDNDCDGSVDNITVKPSQSSCGTLGVCAGGAQQCSGNLWTCDWAGLTAKGYEAFEQTCDGKDNDCDGQTDESAAPVGAGCKGLGVCAWGVEAKCVSGKGACDYSHVAAYQDVTETLCDGLDNDCDGQTDEPESLDGTPAGCSLGVCANKATAACVAGKWSCDTSAVTGFEKTETKCDGKDNDCDGLTDEGLSDPGACPTAGVCAVGVASACIAGKYACSFVGIPGYESVEATCDGKDNDCDGKVDIGLCGPGAACSAANQCAGGACIAVAGTANKVCGASSKQCAAVNSTTGKVEVVDDGSGLCASAEAIQTCTAGTLSAAANCPKDKPTCVAGQCVICAPNSKSCDPSDKTKLIQCSADGLTSQPAGACATGLRCAGVGDCVPDGEMGLVDLADAVVGYDAVALSGGGFAVAWTTDGASAGQLHVRIFDAKGSPVGPSSIAHGTKAPIKGAKPAMAELGAGFAVAWTTSDTGQDIALGIYDATGKSKGPPVIANDVVDGDQGQPAIAARGAGLTVAWSGANIDDDGQGIAARQFDGVGAAVGAAIAVNTDANLSDATSGDQQQPAVACRASGECAVVFTHQPSFGKSRIRGRFITAAGVASGATVAVSSGTSVGTSAQTQLAATIAWTGTTWLMAWQGEGFEGGSGYGIGMRYVDSSFKLVNNNQPTLANVVKDGNQGQPFLRARAGGAVLLWSVPGLGSLLDFTATGTPLSQTETNFGSGATASAYLATRLIVLGDGKQLILFVKDSAGPTDLRGQFR